MDLIENSHTEYNKVKHLLAFHWEPEKNLIAIVSINNVYKHM